MIDIQISQEIKEACPNTALGLIQAKINVNSSSDFLISEIDGYCSFLREQLKLEELTSDLKIKAAREAYKALGKSPSKYRLSSEALIRRILQGKGIYRVNNIVDINNLISIKSKFPVGSYDVNNIDSHIVLNRAEEGARYKGIGKDLLNIEFLPVLTDKAGHFGSPTSDCERAMITEDAKEILMCIYSFSGDKELYRYLNEAQELLEKYADGSDFEINIIR
ncbi:MAG: B3/4 domain-containing protein [Clostridium sp.]